MADLNKNNSSDNMLCDSTSITTSGRVKWFNNKAGYGFITVSTGEQSGSDVFVHHSAIQVDHEQYRYLVQGEYVNFELCKVNDDKHTWQAGTVKGINGGKLMCETRLESRENRINRTPPPDGDIDRKSKKNTIYAGKDETITHFRVKTRGPGPREGDEWMLVRRVPGSKYNNSNSTRVPLRTREK